MQDDSTAQNTSVLGCFCSFLFSVSLCIPAQRVQEDPCRNTNSNISVMKKYAQQKPGLFGYLETVWLRAPFYRVYQ